MEVFSFLLYYTGKQEECYSLLKEVISGLGCDCKKTSMLTIVSYWY